VGAELSRAPKVTRLLERLADFIASRKNLAQGDLFEAPLVHGATAELLRELRPVVEAATAEGQEAAYERLRVKLGFTKGDGDE
jgi:hypothetical protein